MSCCCHHLLESGLCCQHHGFSSIVTNLASWCGMLLLVISCTLLKGIKHQFTPCALIIRKTFTKGYSYVRLVKKDNHTLWNWMNIRQLSSVYIMAFGSSLWGLCHLIQ
ncbi:hypothetical protein ACB094_05G071800 [Castanea mollissima]